MKSLLAVLIILAVPASAEPFLEGLTAYEAKNFTKAKELMQVSADEGNDYAQAYLGHMYYSPAEGSTDVPKALELFRAAAKAGNPAGEFSLGMAYDDEQAEAGKPWEYNRYQAGVHYSRAAGTGFTAGKLALVDILVEGPESSKNPPEGLKILHEVIDAGDSSFLHLALWDMAACYGRGYGVPEDHTEAARWSRKAALMIGDGKALEAIDAYTKEPINNPLYTFFMLRPAQWDMGGEQGSAETVVWLRRDAAAGRASAQYIVGAMSEEGFDGKKNVAKAVDWYKKSAAQDYAPAQKRLEVLVPKEKKEAPAVAAAPTVFSSDVDKAPFKLKERPNDFAFIVGVEKYKNVPEARFAERDAAAFKAHAAALGIPERNIIYLSGDAATKTKIQAYLDEWLPKNVKAGSTLLVYYSGHGAPDAETHQAFLLPWDADPQFLQSTAYPLKDVYAALNKLKAKRVIVALDSCFSGAGGRSVIAPGLRPLVTKINPLEDAGKLVIFSAASGEQVSGSMDDQGHGVFTYYFLKGLEAAAKGAPEEFTADSVYFYLKPRVEDASARQNRTQSPQLAGAGGEILLPLK